MTVTQFTTTIKQIKQNSPFPISGIVAILIGSLLFIVLIIFIIIQFQKYRYTKSSVPSNINQIKKKSIPQILHQYLITTRTNRRSRAYSVQIPSSPHTDIHQTLVAVEC